LPYDLAESEAGASATDKRDNSLAELDFKPLGHRLESGAGVCGPEACNAPGQQPSSDEL
jgi:hypothetical protein